ncbi:acyltransferase family protein [Streptococcus sp. 45]|uniref:acyltransferase family protein n=1 Tax=Streptococcus sp. 45 TaxID=1855326 RepID=UPI000B850395|nr:acyltransferase family protein [Streptococcus sp. 45]
MKKRIVELDIAKAISIAIIVFSHLTFSGQFQRNFVSLFDVPVFFILSGFFKNTSFKESISEGIKRYLVPAYFFLLLDIFKDIFISNGFVSFF